MIGHRLKLGLVLMLAVLPSACECGDCCCPDQRPTEVIVPAFDEECPHSWDQRVAASLREMHEREGVTGLFGRVRIEPVVMLDSARLTDSWNIPEFNDCQRFILPSDREGLTYGGTYAIFSVQLIDLADRLSHGSRPQLAAVVFSPDDEPYQPLGIEREWQCLMLSGTPGESEAELDAIMVPVDKPDDCLDRDLEVSPGTPLEVIRRPSPVPVTREDDYPPVARWGYDESQQTQYAIVKCGDATCYVGVSGFTPRGTPGIPAPEHLGDAAGSSRLDRVFQIPGWHDTQLLAMIDPATMSIVPSDTWATVIPHPHLESWDSPFVATDEWKLVAWVAISSDLYMNKLGLTQTEEGGPLNEVWACHGTGCPNAKASCSADSESEAVGGQPGSIEWRTMIINSRGGRKFMCGRRFDNKQPLIRVPGTTRFRWLATDEMLWYRCLEGCCDTEP